MEMALSLAGVSKILNRASMEPRLLRHGNNANQSIVQKLELPGLQWSHVFSDMETPRACESSPRKKSRLQWSHVFSDMEIRSIDN
jgi:hypothetical protein